MIQLYSNYDNIANEICSDISPSLQVNYHINSETMISNKSKSSKGKSKSARSKQSNKSKDNKANSYFSEFCVVTQSQFMYLSELVNGNSYSEQQFFYQLYHSQMLPQNLTEDKSIPIPSETLHKKFSNYYPNVKALTDKEIVKLVKLYDKEAGKCSEYKIPLEILKQSVKDELIDDETYVNLFTGKKINKARKSVLTYGDNKLKLPDVVYRAIIGIRRTYCNYKALKKYIQKLKDANAKGFQTEKQYRKYINDLACFNAIRRNIIYLEGTDLGYYIPAYQSQKSGRITELEGKLQSCSRAMKKAAFTFPDCYNYDLKSSQVYILKWWFEKSGISTEWIDMYLASDKKKWAASIGIPVKCFKNCMYAKFMGAELPSAKRYWDKKAGKYKPEFFCLSIVEYLYEQAEKINKGRGIVDDDKANEDLMFELLEKFNNFIKPLQKQLNQFYKWLIYDYCKVNSKKGIVRNLTEMPFDLKEYKDSNGEYENVSELNRKLTAFFLQGTESAFIHYLTREDIQEKYNYEVINNAHDGLVTIGVIPEVAAREARKAIGLPYAFLEEKDICSIKEENWRDTL